jgi:Cytochrome P450
MNEFLHDKIEEAKRGGPQKEGMDIMGQLVQSKYGRNASPASESKDGVPNILNDSEIIGNAFIMIVAGHETTANTLHFALLELANNPGTQRRMQRDIDNLFNGADPSTWDYERSINALMASYTGAVVNETLRMMPPVTGIPKVVNPECDQRITINGREHVLPAGVSCALQIVCAQRNPRWWPTRPSERTGKPNDMDDFLPERWYRSRDELRGAKREGTVVDDVAVPEDKTDYGGFQGSDTSAALYRPVRGSYAPFSDGPRSCLGRRIAMVEMNAVLAVIFQKYSIELAVDDWASDEEVAKMSPAERRAVYARAQERSRQLLREADSVLTLKLHGGRHVPVRFVKRGCERFVADPELV